METLTKGWQVLLGSLLGDGGLHILGNCKNASFKEYHSMKQVEYLKWKHKTLPFKTKFLQSTKTTEEKKYFGMVIYSKAHPRLTYIREKCYLNGKKRATYLLKDLDALGLAVWFCDDGYYSYRGKMGGLCTQLFDIQALTLWFKEKWGLTPIPHSEGIRFSVKETQRLIRIIKPHILRMPTSSRCKRRGC